MITTTTTTMESLALPQDLYWDGGAHLITLPSTELFSIYENLLNADVQTDSTLNFNDSGLIRNNNQGLHNNGVEITEIPNFTEANLFASLTQPVDSAIYDDETFDITNITPNYNKNNYLQTKTVSNQLTPPSSPPQIIHSPTVQESLFLQSNVTTPTTITTVTASTAVPNFDGILNEISGANINDTSRELCIKQNDNTIWHSLPDAMVTDVNSTLCDDELAREIQIVDDILKSAVNELFDGHNTSTLSSSISSSSKDEYSSSSDGDVYDDDDEELLQNISVNENNTVTANRLNKGSCQKRFRSSYNYGPEDRKIRKKEQNKNAATRYRQKKKLEMESILVEEQVLLKRNIELKGQYNECKREAKYLKKLIREFYQHKHS